jgi:acyl-CoA synthetase (AMP-forming)/AMP-acid ligase II
VYEGDPQKTADAHIAPGVFTLGEIGYVDDDGFVFITDRFSDMVVSGGVNIYPAEVEQVLERHPTVADVACLGLPDDEMGERLVALVQRASGSDVDAETLSAWCRQALAGYKCPREFRFVTVIPRNAMGKIDKRALRSALPAEP